MRPVSEEVAVFLAGRLDDTQKLAQAYLDHAVARNRPGPERWAYGLLLREVDAGRAILAEYDRALVKARANVPLINALKRLMQARAAVYSDHPDYRQEWARETA